METNSQAKVFHLAITMAGAVSAGAYTAGVIDYLLETLDKWYDLKEEAQKFFKAHDHLKGKTWEELNKMNLEKDILKKAKLYNAIPTHDIQIEILSGASAGGMTAAITSFVLHQKNKHSVKNKEDAETKSKSRLYRSWVNLTEQSDLLPELLNETDIKENPNAPFPLSLFNSKFIRVISSEALKITNKSNIKLADYVAPDFNLFVTLTNLKGFAKTVKVDRGGAKYQADFITFDHRDLMLFDFCDQKTEGIINVNFTNLKEDKKFAENSLLLQNAAISTGAFPIGLEYGFIKRDAKDINQNFLLNPNRSKKIVETVTHHSVFIDGGLINNEPFDLTGILLRKRLSNKFEPQIFETIRAGIKAKYPKLNDEQVLKRINFEKVRKQVEERLENEKYNRTILMIDPFPSEKQAEPTNSQNGQPNQYPFSFFSSIIQLLSAMRTQLLLKSDLLEKGFNETDFDCFLIAPRRRIYKTDDKGLPIKVDGIVQPEFETDEGGNEISGNDGNPIPKAYDGSLAIACGALWGFGGFLSRDFREHDFFLGRLNCKSFLRHHFRIETNKPSVVNEGYVGEAAKIFHISETQIVGNKKEITNFVPLIPDVGIIDKILNGKKSVEYFQERKDIDLLYGDLDYPEYSMKQFRKHRKAIKKRLMKVVFAVFGVNNSIWSRLFLKPIIWTHFILIYRFYGFNQISSFVKKKFLDWQLIKKKEIQNSNGSLVKSLINWIINIFSKV